MRSGMPISLPDVSERTPEEITSRLRDVLRIFSDQEPVFLDVLPAPGTVPTLCYVNVARQITREGGSLVHGWIVYEGGGGRYLKLIHHGVWQKPDGVLVDVTPTDEARNLFLPDKQVEWSGKWIPARYANLDGTERTDQIIEFCKNSDIVTQEGIKSLGMRHLVPKSNSRIGRNEACPCGSGKKYKKCCLSLDK